MSFRQKNKESFLTFSGEKKIKEKGKKISPLVT
jgi:hypothetical protein